MIMATVLMSAGALTACGGTDDAKAPAKTVSPTPAASAPASTGAATSPPTDPGPLASGRLLLRWRMTGGFAGVGNPGSLPEFSLYGDGRAVAAGKNGGKPMEYRLKPDALARLMNEAKAAGLDHSQTIGPENIADAMILQITMGDAKTRVIQPESQSTPITQFWKKLEPAAWPKTDQAAPARTYEPAKVALLAGQTGGTEGENTRPFTLVPLGRGEQASGGMCTVVSGDKAKEALKLSSAAKPTTQWRNEGKVYSLRFRPLLPDEKTCADVAVS
ncbi:hypothetical protein J4573_24635 [Actinomadura barringtoniae]|uniref:Uncharacterized protein n=1 Tax=Actinomadura barringtoniae TaxID=1427535 RepID=A0A939PCW4_9ACTN|nr:hypothetical protein [Actinomadura barringtoniae]MBO2450311.1 hypothetical protein [Actinomadura barringtoniae]